MGKKVNPLAMRPNFKKCQWFTSNKRHFAQNVLEDYNIRELAAKTIGFRLYADLVIARIGTRRGNQTTITINTHKPSAIVGSRDNKVPLIDEYKKALQKHIFQERPFNVLLVEIYKPELNAIIIANNLAEQIEARASVKNVMKKAMNYFHRSCLRGGIKIVCSGRVGGAEIARTEKVQEGKMPLASIKADIQMHIAVAHTVYGTVSVKVLVYIPPGFTDFKEKPYFDYQDKRRFSNSSNYNKYPSRNNSKAPRTGGYYNKNKETSTETPPSHETKKIEGAK